MVHCVLLTEQQKEEKVINMTHFKPLEGEEGHTLPAVISELGTEADKIRWINKIGIDCPVNLFFLQKGSLVRAARIMQ